MNFKNWIINEELNKDTINWWAKYARNMKFNSEQEARDWIFYKSEKADKETYGIFPNSGTEYNKKLSLEMPIYQSGKNYKIGKKIRNNVVKFTLKGLNIKYPDIQELNTIANSNTSGNWEIGKLTYIKINDLIGNIDNDYYMKNQYDRIKNLALQIKNNNWFEPVVVGIENNIPELWEGQHRTRAMKLLGFNTVPAIPIVMES